MTPAYILLESLVVNVPAFAVIISVSDVTTDTDYIDKQAAFGRYKILE
jgi:hypothetical protein